MLKKVPVIPLGLAKERAHAQIWAELVVADVLFDAHDQQIVVSSLLAGSAVTSLNTVEFRRVCRDHH